MNDMNEIENYTCTVKREMSWGQMDAFQHMNNVEYFRYFEDSRIRYFEEIGVYDGAGSDTSAKIGPILAETSCRFKRPVQYPAVLIIGARVSQIRNKGLTIEHAISTEESNRLAAEGTAEIVSYDYENQNPVPVPDRWREVIQKIES